MLAAAGATNALKGALKDLDGTSVGTSRSLDRTTRDTDRLSSAAVQGSAAIDRYSGRMGILLRVAASLGPALVPVGAVAIPAVTGLANQLGFAAIAAGTAVVAFQGIGTALTAVNKANLEPTVKNLEEAHAALKQLSPAGRDFVAQLDEMRPLVAHLRDTAQGGLFPGLVEGFESLERLGPQVNRIIKTVSEAMGELFADGASSLAGPRWADFFSMIEREARPALIDMGHAIGDVAHGLSEMWEAFMPLNQDFGSWIADVADDFDKWATGLSETEGFKEFIDYIRTNGPVVGDAMVAISSAILQIIEAAAPLGGPVLKAITAIANVFGAIADSEFGTPIMVAVTAMSALSLASKVATASVTATQAALLRLAIAAEAASAKMATLNGAPAPAGGAGTGAAAGIAGITAALVGLENSIGNVKDAFSGDMGGLEFLTRTLIPGINSLELLGVNMDAVGDKIKTTLGPQVIDLANNFGLLEDVTVTSWGSFGDWGDAAKPTTDKLMTLGAAFDDAARGGAAFTRETIRTAREMKRNEELLVRTKERIHGLADAYRAERDAIGDAAQGFVDFGHKASAAEFTLDGWLDKLERQTDAMHDFRINAERAAEKGLSQGLIKELRTMGTEGALQLKRLADASEAQIDRANAAWRRYARETRLAKSEVENTRIALHALGGDKARPKIELLGADKADAEVVNTRLKLSALGRTKTNPKINVTSNAAAAAAATAAALNKIADEQVYINVTRTKLAALGGADGMTVPGPHWPYGDKVFAHLAPGEEVITNRHGEADQFRADRAAGRIPSYADGGAIGGQGPRFSLGSGFGGVGSAFADVNNQLRFEALLRAQALREQKRHLTELLKLQEKQRDSLKEQLEAAKQYAQSIRDGIANIITSSADPTGTRRDWRINAETGEVEWFDAAANFDSASDAVETQLHTAQRLSELIRKLRRKGFKGPALGALLSQGFSIETIEDFANQSESALAAYAADYEALGQAQTQVGNQGVRAEGVAGEIGRLREEYRETNRKIDKTNEHLSALKGHAKDIDHGVRHEGPRNTGDAVVSGLRKVGADKQRASS